MNSQILAAIITGGASVLGAVIAVIGARLGRRPRATRKQSTTGHITSKREGQ